MIEFQTHRCGVCGEQFRVACESELQTKLKYHKCPTGKRLRSQQMKQQQIALFVHDTAVNSIEQHNFDKLVMQGIIV